MLYFLTTTDNLGYRIIKVQHHVVRTGGKFIDEAILLRGDPTNLLAHDVVDHQVMSLVIPLNIIVVAIQGFVHQCLEGIPDGIANDFLLSHVLTVLLPV